MLAIPARANIQKIIPIYNKKIPNHRGQRFMFFIDIPYNTSITLERRWVISSIEPIPLIG